MFPQSISCEIRIGHWQAAFFNFTNGWNLLPQTVLYIVRAFLYIRAGILRTLKRCLVKAIPSPFNFVGELLMFSLVATLYK